MGNIGIKVSRAGFPVDTASDRQLLFSSSFLCPLAVFSQSIPANTTIAHNLGYVPFWINPNLTVDDTYVKNNVTSQAVYCELFNLSIRHNLNGVNIDTTDTTAVVTSGDYGFKVSQVGNDVSTASLGQLLSFSGISVTGCTVTQLVVHQIGYQDNISDNSTVTFSHNLGYIPLVFFFMKDHGDAQYNQSSGDTRFTVVGGQIIGTVVYNATVDSSQVTFTLNNYGQNMDFAYVMFKNNF